MAEHKGLHRPHRSGHSRQPATETARMAPAMRSDPDDLIRRAAARAAGGDHQGPAPVIWMDRYSVGRIVRPAGLNKHIGPHALRNAFITAVLDAGVPLCDVQEATSHADPRRPCATTRRSLGTAPTSSPPSAKPRQSCAPPQRGRTMVYAGLRSL